MTVLIVKHTRGKALYVLWDDTCQTALVRVLLLFAFVAGCASPHSRVDAGLLDTAGDSLSDSAVDSSVPISATIDSDCGSFEITARTVLDLTASDLIGTCGQYRDFGAETFVPLPSDPVAYPIAVRLPRVDVPDPACSDVCSDIPGDAITTYGIAVGGGSSALRELGWARQVFVDEPWAFVSGGCGEACAWPCVDGYQEFVPGHFGEPLQCVTMNYGDFGFATDLVPAAATIAWVRLVPFNDWPRPQTDEARVARGGETTELLDGMRSVLDNDVEPDGEELFVTNVSEPQWGAISIGSDGTFTYVHDGGDSSRDVVSFDVCDRNPVYMLCQNSVLRINVE